jgi:MFS family permease
LSGWAVKRGGAELPRRARLAVASTFAANGALFGSWVPRIPEVKHELGLSSAALGLALLAPSLGSLLTMKAFGAACQRYGSGPITRLALLGFGALAWLPGIASNFGVLCLVMLIWGVFIGGIDVAMNSQGVTVEKAYGRPVLSGFHAAWSLGTLVGSGVGAAGAAFGTSIVWQQVLFAVVVIAPVGLLQRDFLPDPQAVTFPASAGTRRGPELRLIVLGVAAFFALLSEGSVADWSGVLLRDSLHAASGQAGLAYAAFSATMTLGRLFGDRIVLRYGRVRTIAVLAAIGAVGVAGGLASDTLLGAIIGFALLGLGLSVLVPVAFSAAADGADPGPAISTVSTIGYTGFLVGPTLIGLIASGTSVLSALWLVPIFTAVAGVLASAAAHVTNSRAAVPD